MTLVLETLGSDEALDTGSFGVGFLAFALGLDFAADDEFADLVKCRREDQNSIPNNNIEWFPSRSQEPPIRWMVGAWLMR